MLRCHFAIGSKAASARLQLGQVGMYIYSSPKSSKCSHNSVGIVPFHVPSRERHYVPYCTVTGLVSSNLLSRCIVQNGQAYIEFAPFRPSVKSVNKILEHRKNLHGVAS